MNISNLKEGMEVKNYGELCKLLTIEEKKGGNIRKAQLKELERYFNYERKGHKYIIKEIYEIPLPPNNNITKYIPLIEKLILHILFENGADCVLYINKSKLYQMLKMINDQYTNMKYHKMQLSKKYDLPQEVIKDFYNTSDDLLERNVQQALKSLERQSLVKSTEVYSVCEVLTSTYNQLIIEQTQDDYGDIKTEPKIHNTNTVKRKHRRATKEETQIILGLQHDQLTKLGCREMPEVYSKGLIREFYEPINEYLLYNHNIEFYYSSYELIFNQNHVTKAYIENNSFLLDEEAYYITSSILNNNISDKIKDMANNRKEKAKLIEYKSNMNEVRSKDDYIENINLLVSKLVHTK